MKLIRSHSNLFVALLFCPAFILGCAAITSAADSMGIETTHVRQSIPGEMQQVREVIGLKPEEFTPDQEYYLGRSVAAEILRNEKYEPLGNENVDLYLNLIGQSLALVSERPVLPGSGYRFIALDSDEINAFATPGGIIMVTTGALMLAESEDAVASILAHEIAHVEARHGLEAIQASRLRQNTMQLFLSRAPAFSNEQFQNLYDLFQGSVEDITQALVDSGYSRHAEWEADRATVRIMQRIGYDPWAYIQVLSALQERQDSSGSGFFKTHPSPERRMTVVREAIGPNWQAPDVPAQRHERFKKFRALLDDG